MFKAKPFSVRLGIGLGLCSGLVLLTSCQGSPSDEFSEIEVLDSLKDESANRSQATQCQAPPLTYCDIDYNDDNVIDVEDAYHIRDIILGLPLEPLESHFYDFSPDGRLSVLDVVLLTSIYNGFTDESDVEACDCFNAFLYEGTNHQCNTEQYGDDPTALYYADNGSGTPSDPYRIYTPQALASMDNQFVTAWIEQCNDLDFSNYYSPSQPYFTVAGQYFDGGYNGNNFEIRGFQIDFSQPQNMPSSYTMGNFRLGLFKTLLWPAEVKNLNIRDADISVVDSAGNLVGERIGLLAGDLLGGDVDIENVHVSGDVKGNENVGGLAGYAERGQMRDVSAEVNLSGQKNVGGAIGVVELSSQGFEPAFVSIENLSVDAHYSGSGDQIGGAFGLLAGPSSGFAFISLTNSEVNAVLNLDGTTNIGGLVARATGQVNLVANKVNSAITIGNELLPGVKAVGGVVGYAGSQTLIERLAAQSDIQVDTVVGAELMGGFAGIIQGAEIKNSFVHQNILVNGSEFVRLGGFVGDFRKGLLRNTYASGKISFSVSTSALSAGGFAGRILEMSNAPGPFDIVDSFAQTAIEGNFEPGISIGPVVGLTSDAQVAGQIHFQTPFLCGAACNTIGIGHAGPNYFYSSSAVPLNNWNFTDPLYWVETDENGDGTPDRLPILPSTGLN